MALRPASTGWTLTCSLLPAAGTVSVGTSSCLSLSQHPSPTSVFRHHYIPYFRGKVRSAAGCGRSQGIPPHVCVSLSRVRRMASPSPVCPPVPLAVCLVSPAPSLSVCKCSWEEDVGSSWREE